MPATDQAQYHMALPNKKRQLLFHTSGLVCLYPLAATVRVYHALPVRTSIIFYFIGKMHSCPTNIPAMRFRAVRHAGRSAVFRNMYTIGHFPCGWPFPLPLSANRLK